jgi:hypothetical protein
VLASQSAFDAMNALIIAGDPRGGTTWLAEILRRIPRTAMLWEPLATANVPEFRNLGFSWRQHIPESERWTEAELTFRRLFEGRLLSPYLCRNTTPRDFGDAHHLLIKFCRANQLLPWLTTHFNFQNPPVYLVRHPCAVVASQLRQGGWSHVAPKFEIPDGRYRSFYSDHLDFLGSVDSVEKRLAAVWCLCNLVPLKHHANNVRWITITYESLLQDPVKQLRRIAGRWKIDFPVTLYESVANVSATTVGDSPIRRGMASDQLTYWKTQLTRRQLEDIFFVLRYFNVDLYDKHEMPHAEFT